MSLAGFEAGRTGAPSMRLWQWTTDTFWLCNDFAGLGLLRLAEGREKRGASQGTADCQGNGESQKARVVASAWRKVLNSVVCA